MQKERKLWTLCKMRASNASKNEKHRWNSNYKENEHFGPQKKHK